jgi:hypothetical protein
VPAGFSPGSRPAAAHGRLELLASGDERGAAWRAETSFCSSRRIGPTFFSKSPNCFFSSASFARASASRSATMPIASLPTPAPDEVAQLVGVLADEERHLGVDGLGAEDLRRAAPEALGEERQAARARSPVRGGFRSAS